MSARRTAVIRNVVDSRTAVVELRRQVVHPKYGKRYHRTTTLLVDTAVSRRLTPGTTVTIEATRPLSKRKAWKIVTVDDQRQTQNVEREISDDALSRVEIAP